MATTYSITWPVVVDQVPVGTAAAPITLTLDSVSGLSSSFSVNDSAMGGTFTPSAPSIPAGQLSVTFTYRPSASTSTRTIPIAVSNSAALTDPSPSSRSFVVTRFGFDRPTWVANMRSAPILATWASYAKPAPIAPLGTSQALHYDSIEVLEAIGRFTGDPATFNPLIANAIYQYRDLFVIPNGGGARDFNNWCRGLRDAWVLAGDETSRQAAMMLSLNGTYTTDQTSPTAACSDQSNSRPTALSLMSYLDAEDCGSAHRSHLDGNGGNNYVNVALGHCIQWLTPEASWGLCQFMQPFMVGITLRSLIAYWDRYRDTRNSNFANLGATIPGSSNHLGSDIPAVVKQILDMLWTGSNRGLPFWYPDQYHPTNGVPAYPTTPHPPWGDGSGFPVGPAGTGAFGYFYPDTGVLSISMDQSCTLVRAAGAGSPVPSAYENHYLSPAFYWYYLYSGDDTYRQRGDTVFAGSVASSPSPFGTGTSNDVKTFNQSYFWSIEGVAWRTRAISPPAAATALTLTGPSPPTGLANVPSNPFVVALNGAVSLPVTVTPTAATGRFIPTSVMLTTDRPQQAFRFVPAASAVGSNVAIGIAVAPTGLATPATVSYAVTGPAATIATAYSVTLPTDLSVGPHLYTDPFSIALIPPGSVPGTIADAEGGIIRITHGQGTGGAGQFSPAVSYLTADRPSGTFTYYPNGTASRIVATGNWIGWSDPFGFASGGTTIAPAASDYTIAGPTTGAAGVPSAPFTLTKAYGTVPVDVATNLPGVIPVTLADGGGAGAGTFSALPIVLSDASPTGTATYTAGATGSRTITPTILSQAAYPTRNVIPGGTNPAPVAYAATSSAPARYLVLGCAGGAIFLGTN